MYFKVAITETRRRYVCVNANTPQEAHRRVTDAWNNCEVTLNDNDFDGIECYVIGEMDNDESLYNIERKNA